MSTLIIQFAKSPQLGKVKTRLQPTLGEEGCLALHQNLVRHTADTIHRSGFAAKLFVSLLGEYALFNDINLEIHEQQGTDLGARMFHAFQIGLAEYKKVILVGSDCPVIPDDHYQKVDAALEENDFCFIPAEDGGYVLIACKKLKAEIFSEIDWGTDQVWAQTQQALKGESVAVLDALWDVDRAEDFIRLKQTIPSLCEL